MKTFRQILLYMGYRHWKPVEYHYLTDGVIITYECEWSKERKSEYEYL